MINYISDSSKPECEHVKFISYTGKWPNLCSGVLTLEIDGEEVKFGHDYSKPIRPWGHDDEGKLIADGNYEIRSGPQEDLVNTTMTATVVTLLTGNGRSTKYVFLKNTASTSEK